MKSSPASRLLVPALGLLVAACNIATPAQSDPTRTYVLSGAAPAVGARTAEGGLRIGLKSVAIAAYLKGRSMVVRHGANEVVMAEYARWGEPLDAGLGRILRSHLAASPAVARIYPEPFPFDTDRDFDVAVTVSRCEGIREPGGRSAVRLEALVEVTRPGAGGAEVVRRLFTAPEAPWDGGDYAQLAALLSQAADALGSEVVAALPASP